MLITKVEIPADKQEGLADISMSRLGQVVLIAGKNGSGKSRILSKIRKSLSQKPTINHLTGWKTQLEQNKKNLSSYTTSKERTEKKLNTGSALDSEVLNEQITNLKANIDTANQNIKSLQEQLSWSLLTTSKIADSYQFVDLVPKILELEDCNKFNKEQLIQNAGNLDSVGINHSPKGTLAKIQFVQDQWFNATHPKSSISKKDKKEIISSYKRLSEYINTFLITKLDRDRDGNATIFGFRLGNAKLSDGQKVLLQLCVALFSQETKLSELIIFMDEPENHLHPEALIEVIDKLINAVGNGQIWIATHSINLLAHYDQKYIWYVENGAIKYSGNVPERVLTGLIGGEEEISLLSNFLSLPAQMATTKFSFECLFAPQALSTGSDDPQTNQIHQVIEASRVEGKKIRVLDFGAGKGRLLSTIHELDQTNQPLSEWLDYFAFDIASPDSEECRKTIKEIYGDATRYFDKENKLLEHIKAKSLDLIVMCNVFHEIDPKAWLTLFSSNGLVRSALSDSGTLLIVEDQLLAIGEKAYPNGFLVFDVLQFQKLFKISNYPVLDARGDERLKAHFIPSSALGNIDQHSRIAAIEDLAHKSKSQIQELRKSEASFKNGKLHAFWTQQLANANLVLDELRI